MVYHCRIFTVGVVLSETDLCLAMGKRILSVRSSCIIPCLRAWVLSRRDLGVVISASMFVRHVFDEEQSQHVVPVPRGVHVSARFITAFPEGGAEFGFLEGHGRLTQGDRFMYGIL